MVRINLLPVRVSKKKEAGKQQLALFAVLLVAGLLANYLWASARASDLKARQAKLARTREEIAQLERIIGEVRNIKEAQQELQKKLDVLDRLKAGRSGPVRMLDEPCDVGHAVAGLFARAERRAADVDGVGAVVDGLDADVGIAGRGEQFQFGDGHGGGRLEKSGDSTGPAGTLACCGVRGTSHLIGRKVSQRRVVLGFPTG